MKIVGYSTLGLNADYDLSKINTVVFERYKPTSSINPALIFDTSLGSESNLPAFINRCHSAGCKVQAEIFTNYTDSAINNLIIDPTYRVKLITNIVNLLVKYNFDGVDFDWEADVNSNLTPAIFSNFISELYAKLNPLGKTISMASPCYKVTIEAWASQYFDFISVMTYDYTSTWYLTLADFQKYLMLWANAGIPKEKLLGGISFAGRSPWTSYRNIINTYNPSPDLNTVNGLTFNGLNLVLAKTNWIITNGFGGIMCYNLTLDLINDPRGLVNNIYQTIPVPATKTEKLLALGVIAGLMAIIYSDSCNKTWI